MLTTARKVADQARSPIPRVKVPDNGTKTLRILKPLEEIPAHYVHFVELPGTNGGKAQSRPFECLLDDEGNGHCPICERGDDNSRRRTARVILFVLDRKPGEGEKGAGIMEMGPTFFKQLEEMEADWGPVTERDIKVSVSGTGKQRKYSVMPLPKASPFGPTEQGALDEIDISDLVPEGLTYERQKQQFLNFIRSTTFDPHEFEEENGGSGEGDGTGTEEF